MMHSHQTAPTQFVEANSIRFAYRRFGKTGGVPLVLSQHYIGTMDYWDPTGDGWLGSRPGGDLVQQRGRLQQLRRGADNVQADGAADAITFIKALGLEAS